MRITQLTAALLALAPALAWADASMAGFADPLPVSARGRVRIDAVAVLVGTGYMGAGPTEREVTDPEELLRPDLHYHGDLAALTSWLSAVAAIDAVGAADCNAQRATSLRGSAQLLADGSFEPTLSFWSDARAPLTGRGAVSGSSLESVELAHVQLGVDYQVAHRLEVAPVLGGGVDTFLYQDSPTDYSELESKKVNLMGFAGLAGQFGAGH
jgi:hypothetical protein